MNISKTNKKEKRKRALQSGASIASTSRLKDIFEGYIFMGGEGEKRKGKGEGGRIFHPFIESLETL